MNRLHRFRREIPLWIIRKSINVSGTRRLCSSIYPPPPNLITPLKNSTFESTIQIDRSGLFKLSQGATPTLESCLDAIKKENDLATDDSQLIKADPNATPLTQYIKQMIQVRGPIPVAEFMRQAMTHPDLGYYTTRDVIGKAGDFTTAPEICQIFGELIGIWCVATWQAMGQPASVSIVELGPGRGTLQRDLLRTARAFPDFYAALSLHLVEVSPVMRDLQEKALECVALQKPKGTPHDTDAVTHRMQVKDNGPTVTWHTNVVSVPSEGPVLFLAQELFDALPVHQFEYTTRGWCERLVDESIPGDGNDQDFRFTLSPGPTPAVQAFLTGQKVFQPFDWKSRRAAPRDGPPAFVHTGVPSSSSSSSPKTLPLEPRAAAGNPVINSEVVVGDRVEVSPAGIALIEDIATRVSKQGGGALLLDYGSNAVPSSSLRGIRKHAFCHVLSRPGETDLSIDVDFATLGKFARQKSEAVTVFGAVPQGDFLSALGIEARLEVLLTHCESDAEQTALVASVQRLVHADEMGTIFKAMAVMHTDVGVPVGFSPLDEKK